MAIPPEPQSKIDELLPVEDKDGRKVVWLDHHKVDKLLAYLRDETRPGGQSDPTKCRHEIWDCVLNRLGLSAESGIRALVEEFQASWWDSMTEYQIQTSSPPDVCYRAVAGFGLAVNKFASGDLESAVRWCTLARIADVLGGVDSGGGAQHMLRSTLGVPKGVDELLGENARKARDRAASEGWAASNVLPESLLLEMLRGPHFHQFCRRSVVHEHSICRPYYQLVLKEAREDTTGKMLERLAAYLVSSLAGYRPQMSVVAKDLAWEHDVVGTVVIPTAPILPGFGDCILIECKNWREKRINTQVVGHLFARMQLMGCRLGILVTREGVTGMNREGGDSDERAAKAIIRRLYHQTGHLCLVLADRDLDRLADVSFRSLAHEMYEEFVFGIQRAR